MSLHPGVVRTELLRHYTSDINFFQKIVFNIIFYTFCMLVLKSPKKGAQTTLYCALEDFDTLVPGGYYSDCKIHASIEESNSEEI